MGVKMDKRLLLCDKCKRTGELICSPDIYDFVICNMCNGDLQRKYMNGKGYYECDWDKYVEYVQGCLLAVKRERKIEEVLNNSRKPSLTGIKTLLLRSGISTK